MVDDEVLDTFAVRGDPSGVATELRARFGGLADRLTLSMPHTPDPDLPMEVLAHR